LALVDGKLQLRILVDRTSVELFANGGHVHMASCFLPDPDNKTLAVHATGNGARAAEIDVWPLRSIWNTAAAQD